jgi:tetratricopeptide (TPR) repeat protein
MYLDFVKDIFNVNDSICVECGEKKYLGTLVKISSELIAIKTSTGITIIKDSDITNISTIEDLNDSLINNVCEDKYRKNIDNIIDDAESIEAQTSTETAEHEVEIDEIPTISDNVAPSKKSSDLYEIPKPNVKVVGYVDLSKINDPKRKKKTTDSTQNTSLEKSTQEVQPNEKTQPVNDIIGIGDNAKIERYINGLIQSGNSQEAIKKIDEIISSKVCVGRLKSSLLLKKAQTYSAISDYENAKLSYQELIAFNESIKSPSNNLSHLYTELARLQNLTRVEKQVVLATLRKALKYNPGNNYASTLFEQINSDRYEPIPLSGSEESELILETEEPTVSISNMIDIDIREHVFTNEQIINNGGVSTPTIAKSIYEDAKQTKDVDLSERYPIYLEAAKAFSTLPVGSYDTQEYIESVAYYAILKGNSLFIRFKKLLSESSNNITLLTHIKDSACSYYIESLNLLSNIQGEHLLSILGNYLKMNIALVALKSNQTPNISGQFKKFFFDCVRSSDSNLNLIAWTTIIAVGTASARAWNKLTKINGGTSGLYGILENIEARQRIYSILNRINDNPVNTELLPGEFIKKSFAKRNARNKKFRNILSNILKADFDVQMLNTLDTNWREIPDYLDLLSETDQESKKVGDRILRNLLPYSTRQSQIERTNLLYQAQRELELQISFINENTTYYGRTFFFPLFTKWRNEIQNKLDEKISKTLPVLKVIPDPPFLVKDNDDLFVNLIVKNVGESTAEGYSMDACLKSLDGKLEIKWNNKAQDEIPVASHVDKKMNLPETFRNCNAIEVAITISPIYQGNNISPQSYRFTVEVEEESCLTEEDIIWRDGPKMSGVLFKGRQEIMNKLIRHYLSAERDKPYILYGLTRTGKSSILLNLRKELDEKTFIRNGVKYQIMPFEWDLSEASGYGNAKDMWQYLLYESVYEEICRRTDCTGTLSLTISESPRAKDFKTILQYLKEKDIYPMFFVDEFSHIKILLDNHIVNTSFLHTLRQYTLEGLASFIYAGTYDIKELIKDPKYAITGQLVNTVEEQINEIDYQSAEELMNVMSDKLSFTDEAIKHIHILSGDVPYFIQIICKFCGYYAVEKKRRHIGYPELEHVVKILTGEEDGSKDSSVKVLPKSIFQNNLYSPQDRKEVHVLISSICHLNEKMEEPRSVSISKLEDLWNKNGIEAFRPRLAESITLLLERKVLMQSEDEMIPVYRITVDLFRRWWSVHYPDIKLEITTIQ